MAKATGSNKQRKNPMQLGGFLSQVMLRVALVLGLALVLVSIVSAVLLINRTRSEVADQSEIAVSSLAARFARELDEPINELVRAAISATAREYAQTISQLGPNADFEAALSTTQRDLLRNFDDVVRGGSSRIIAVRYIGRDGQLWGQVISRGDETEVTPRVNASLLGAPGLADALTEGVAGQPFLSDVVEVPDTQQTLLYVYVPVATTGNTLNTLGVVQMIVNIDLLDALADDLLNDPLVAQDGREMLVVDNNNRVIAASDAALVNDQGVLAFLAANDGEYVLRSQDDLRISTRVIEDYEGVGTPWRIVMVDQDRLLIQPTIQVIVAVFAFFTGVYIAAMSLIGVLLRPVSRMLRKVSVSAQQLAELDAQSEDEIATLDMAVQRLSARLETLNTTLEIEASRRTRDLELAARIGREVATLYDVDTLVNRAINLIADELGFYHAQVFLVDEAGVNAVLAYSRGAAGRTLLAQRFAIPVGSKTVIGTVTGSGTPVIVNDTQQGDAPHGFNPVLAETRAEIGLPLFSRDRVIGVLDIQSKTAGVFHTADLATYQLLADQLAIALENARLISQTDRRVQQIDILNRQLTRSAWEGIENREDLERGYRYNLLDIEPVEPGPGSNGHERALRSPITIRGEVIGELAALSDDVEFTEGDRVIVDSIAGRVALAIENARLFQETQNSLMETSTLYQLSRYLNEANTLEDIIQAIIVSIMPEASGGQVWMFEEATDDIDEHEWLVISADLAVETREANNENLHGLRLHAPDHVFLRDFNRDGITLINETRVDTRLDTGLKLIFRRLLAEAVVLIPLVVRGEWRGILSMTFATARQFSEREARVYSALSDQAAVAVDNRMLLRQTEQEVARNETLYAASRLINTAETMQDLVYAAVATSTADAALDFSLSLLEGELDAQGWPTRARLVAYSSGVNVVEDSAEFTFFTPEDSPMRSRNPEIIVDDTPSNNNVSPRVHWIREQGYRFMAIFPLFSANQPIALFHIASAELYELTASDYEFYRALTGQMSSQIQVRKLLERTELALDETRRLYVASNAIISAQDARSIYQLAIEHLARPFVSMHEGKRIYEISLLMAWPEVSADAPYLEYVHRWRSDSGTPFGYTLPVRVPMQEMPFNELTEDAASVMLFDDITSDSEANAPLRANRYLLTRMRRSGAVSMLVAPIL
ncbi:MAG: GAF domain-containing protein, partial [Chloroflexota bacterium]